MAYTDKSFFEKIQPMVVEDMKKTGILASLTAAQAFIESSKGNSGLTVKANNLFGIKGTYNGQCVNMLTTEYYNGKAVRVYANFRKYPSWAESIADHSALFNRLARYKNLRGEQDYVKACKNVQADGYATSPKYANTLINTINKYKLYEWDYRNNGDGTFTPINDGASPKNVILPVLKKGSRGQYVLAWQKFLNMNGYICGLEDGKFGENTRLAVIEYQIAKGLKPDGIIGPKTWESLSLANAA